MASFLASIATMGSHLSGTESILLFTVAGFALVGLGMFIASWRQRNQTSRGKTDVSWFSSLHIFGKELSECHSAQEIAEQALRGAVEMLSADQAYVSLHEEGGDAAVQSSSRGVSPQGVEQLEREPLNTYLLGSGRRWGRLMVFPDLRRPEVGDAWQRDPIFHEFREVMRREELRTLIVVGLQIRDKSYGTLMAGFRESKEFDPQELKVVLAIGNQVSVAAENWLLNRAEDRRTRELRILRRVSEALRTTVDLKAQVEILRSELKGLLGGSNFALALQDGPNGPLEAMVPFENEDEAKDSLADSLSRHVMTTREPLMVPSDVPGTVERFGLEPVNPRLKSWAGVPLNFSDGTLGVLALGDMEREHAVSKAQFDLVQVLASEAASAIENARLFQREQERASHLATLNELGRKANAVLNPKELLPSICQQVRDAFRYDLARIEIMTTSGEEMIVEAEAGYGTQLMGRRTRLGNGLSGAAAESGEPAVANNVAEDARYIAYHDGMRSAVSLPLKYREELKGVLTLESKQHNAFSAHDVLTLRTLADQLAVALHNAQAYQQAMEQAITDGLTALKTHRFFMESLDREWRQATRAGNIFSVIMIDLDGFKQVNDRHGHLEGDRVVKAVAALLGERVRHSNVVARYGGDEFAILLPGASVDQAETLAERLRARIATDPFLLEHSVTASFGIASFPMHGPTPEEILRVADSGMYIAKHQNGNCVRTAGVHFGTAPAEWETNLLDAYLGVTMKRMFSTGPEVFEHYLDRLQNSSPRNTREAPSLLDTVTALAFAIDAKDHYTQGHSQSVSRLAALIAEQLGLADSEVEEIRLGGILHDIGKIGVPESVLHKNSRLTGEEFELMKTHTILGEKILAPIKVKAIERIQKMVRNHHEMVDGKGYPDGLKGAAIPLGARIIAVADAFDTMVSARAYKSGRSIDEAIAELRRCSGTQFDPEIVEMLAGSVDRASELVTKAESSSRARAEQPEKHPTQ
jgi:diguanylate cyclase (GGDEF)-like protein/putative nucleotidyltransferase with HDIG domain